jgi:hypothetical protein
LNAATKAALFLRRRFHYQLRCLNRRGKGRRKELSKELNSANHLTRKNLQTSLRLICLKQKIKV